ncbi:hypothetical protein PybrP1_009887 [[Pythium] brassicae (nom. inval.)]|nr:hypothetical protein PybrP1_009887 [[Pythium] brassicae (nom. inval.)]
MVATWDRRKRFLEAETRAVLYVALGRVGAFLIGTSFEDERAVFSAHALVRNDAYRDRLLAPEIADLAALSDALQLTPAQRRALFRCFLHVDFLRRASVSRAELLRYCDLRATPLSAFLLPTPGGKMTHRDGGETQRWDVLQWVAVCFSVCTLELDALVTMAVAAACQPEELVSVAHPREKEDVMMQSEPAANLCGDIERCFAFFIGALSPHERRLQQLLCQLYSSGAGATTATALNFCHMHAVASVLDAAKLFPGGPLLVFPCVWVQKVLQRRMLGPTTLGGVKEPTGSESRLSPTPRKVLPSLDVVGDIAFTATPSSDTLDQSGVDAASSNLEAELGCSTLEGAWRVTANHAIASLCVEATVSEHERAGNLDCSSTAGAARELFLVIAGEVVRGELPSELCEAVRSRLVRAFGYQFAKFLFEKSSLRETSAALKPSAEEKRALRRQARAWGSQNVPEDKPSYWKQFFDPASKRKFYYNIRTGESRWEKPANFVGSARTTTKKKRRKKMQPSRADKVAMDSSEPLDASAATSFDLLDYLDDLALDASELTTDESLKQPVELADTPQKADDDDDKQLDDSTEYIDVTIPWTTTRALTPAIERPLSGSNMANASAGGLNQVLHDVGVAQNQSSPPKHERRSQESGSKARGDLRWRVDLSTLSVAPSGTLEKFHLYKWREMLQLHKLMAVPSFHAVRLAGDDRALFESFHRAFPHELVTKARFVSVLRSVYAIDSGVRRQLRRDELALCRHLDKMQYAFELAADGVACVNWRLLLAGLRMVQEPLLAMKEHLTWTFSVYASSGFLEPPNDSDAISAGHTTLILTHFLRSHAATRFVSERITQAIELLPASAGSSSRMTYRRFKALLQQPPVRALLARATPHTSYWDELASPLYRDFVYAHRKREHDVRAIKRLRFLHATRALRTCFVVWTQLARARRRTRARVLASCGALARVQRMWAFVALKRHAVASIAAVEIQRTFRGYLGRRVGDAHWQRVQAALRVQGAFRMRSHFGRFLRDLRKRHQLAVRVQRVYRGRLARCRVRRRVLAHYYAEMAVLQHERDAFRAHVRDELAKRIQRLFRVLVREKQARRAIEGALARRAAESEREANAQRAARAAQQYRQDVTAAYAKLRDDEQARRQRQQVDALEKRKVVRLRRQREWDAFKSARDDRKAQRKLQSADAYARMKRAWDATTAERTQTRQRFVAQVLLLEEPGEWKALQQSLVRRVRERKKALLARYTSSGVAVPDRELAERAQLEIVEEEAASERQKAEEDWMKAEAEFLNKLDDEEEERVMAENAAERVRREKSAVRVQSAFRRFAARQMLRREIRARFVKEFDAHRQAAVYRNTFSGTSSLRKPFGLGSDDLEFPDQWFRLTDASIGEPFFYNPCRMLQSWEPPSECRLCGSCASPTFAELWSARDDSFRCRQCVVTVTAASPDDYFPYDGSRPKGGY